jgi:hypothetical protein
MNSSINKKDDILKAIAYLQSKKTVKTRNVTLNDLMIKSNNVTIKRNNDKIKSFRMQEEFGPKKRIKP